jgi:hypothetical protein
VDLWPLVLTDGCRAAASGRVVFADGQFWFEPPLPVPLVYYEPGSEPAPRPSGWGVRLSEVDLERLDRRRNKDGATEGWAYLEGIWAEQRLDVLDQRPPRPPPLDEIDHARPPCDPPSGGWPIGPRDENLDVERAQGDEVLHLATFRPSAHQAVLVVTSEDPEHTRDRLAPVFGDRLCVVRSKWSRGQIASVRQAVEDNMRDWTAYLGSLGNTDEHGQVQLSMDVAQVLPALARYAEQVPDGLLLVNPWLAPLPAVV